MSDIAIITSPFQALNAIEYFQNKKPKILILWNEENTLKQIINTLNHFNLKYIDKYINYFDLIIFLIRSSRRKFKKILIGNLYSTPVLISLIILRYKNVIKIDDGTQTLFEEKSHQNPIKKLIFKYVLDKIEKKGLKYFTIFKSMNFKNNILLNNYSFLNKTKIQPTEEKIFIGQPLVELKEIEEISFFRIIDDLILKFSNLKYVVHRRESNIKLNKIENKGLELVYYDFPIELNYFISKQIPSTIISFSSTALFSLKGISKDLNFYFVEFKPKNNVSKHESIKRELTNFGIKKIKNSYD